MAGITHLREIYERKGEEFIKDLLSKYVIISEKLDGSAFSIKKEKGVLQFYKKDEPITYMHRVLSKFYEPAIIHLESRLNALAEQNINLPDNVVVGFEYFPGNDRPLNNILTLSYINRLDENGKSVKMVHDKRVLSDWAKALEVAEPPILFQGHLSEEQKQEILDFVFTPFNELSDKYKTTSFSKHIVKTLNPSQVAIYESGEKEFDSVIFRFYESNGTEPSTFYVTKLVDPSFSSESFSRPQVKGKKSDDYVWLTVSDIMNFIESFSYPELNAFDLKGESYDQRYVSLLNEIYKKFIEQYGNKYRGINITIPEYLRKDEFNINYDLIKDPQVIKFINQNETFKEVYRIALNVFRKKKDKVNSNFFSESMIQHLNSQIDKIQKVVSKESIFEGYFPTFNEFIGGVSDANYFTQFDIKEGKKKATKVNLLVAEFQPFNNNHLETAMNLKKKNGCPVVLIAITPDKPNSKNPIPAKEVKDILTKVVKEYPEIVCDCRVISKGVIAEILKVIKPEYDPIFLAATSNRLKDYSLQLEHARRKALNYNIKKEFQLLEAPMSTIIEEVKSALKANDYASFKKLVPRSVYSGFVSISPRFQNEVVNESKKYDNEQIDSTINFLEGLKGKEKSEEVDRLLENFTKSLVVFNMTKTLTEIKESIKNKGYSETVAHDLTKLISRLDLPESDIENFKNFLTENKGIPIDLEKASVIDLTQTRLNEKILDIIVHYQEPGLGKGLGEAIAILFEKGEKAKIGDILINESLIEVKKDKGRLSSSRRNGENSFISGREVLITRVLELTQKFKINESVQAFILSIGENGLNINLENMKNWMTVKEMLEGQGVVLEQFASWFADMFANRLFHVPETFDLIFEKAVDAFDSSVLVDEDSKELINSILYANFKYYAKVDGFKGMIGIGTRFKNNNSIVYIPENISYSEFKKFISPDSGLSWSDTRHSSFRIHVNRQ